MICENGPQTPSRGTISVLFVCTGNICRSPMAEFAMKKIVEDMGIKENFHIESAAITTEEIWNGIGNPVYPPARTELKRHGIGNTPYTDFSGKRARQIQRSDYDKYDYILCAESHHVSSATRICGGDPEGKIMRMLEFSNHPRNIADPWYTGIFDVAYNDIEESIRFFLDHLGYSA